MVRVVEQSGSISGKRRPMECVDVLVVDSRVYRDTLAAGRFLVDGGSLTIAVQDTGRADLVVDLPGYFPAKFVDVPLSEGTSILTDKVLMVRSSTPVALPGYLGFTLKPDLTRADVENIYRPYGKVKVQSAPGNHFELKLPFRGAKGTRRDVEVLLGRLVRSPHVASARPLVEYSAAVRGY